MAKQDTNIRPRTYFLNETHELTRAEKEGGGGQPKFGPINWAAKGATIRSSLDTATHRLRQARDPLRGQRFFMMALPSAGVPKITEAKGQTQSFQEPVNFKGRDHARVFGRLGLDLVDVTSDGKALVHAKPDLVERLSATSGMLAQAGPREQARWSTIDSFDVIPETERVDLAWLRAQPRKNALDIVFELQPLLTAIEADLVMRAVRSFFGQQDHRVTGTGKDLSGRQWARARVAPDTLLAIAKELSSVQSIHPPLYALAASGYGSGEPVSVTTLPARPDDIAPVVAVLDHGVPAGHVLLSAYRRGGQVIPRGAAAGAFESHGSNVASRVVFGEVREGTTVRGDCQFLDVRISDDDGSIHNKNVFDGLSAVSAAYPDVRVFNLSIAIERPLELYDGESRKEMHRMLRELDNFVFDRDVVMVIAAGNAPEGAVPVPPYPDHMGDPSWQLGPWACGFNTLVCGSYVGHASQGGLGDPDWPSPFTKIGPGICKCPVPSFGAPGGNTGSSHRTAPGMGVLVCNNFGEWVEKVGTSLAAPLLAREAAIAVQRLKRYCLPDSNPFAPTAKAFLTIAAEARPILSRRAAALAERTLGRGLARAHRLADPLPSSAVVMWQGIIGGPDERVRVMLPIPEGWIRQATKPMMRLVAAWDTPVNDANPDVWACRRVEVKLHPGIEQDIPTLRGSRAAHPTYPLIDRHYDLRKLLDKAEVEVDGDMWMLDISYTEQKMAEYYLGASPDPRQKVGLAAELYDEEASLSPQTFLQSLPIAATMQRLSAGLQAIPVPVRLPGS